MTESRQSRQGMDRDDIADRLVAAIAEWNPAVDEPIEPDTPLVTSGRLDSVNLVELMMWIEHEVGRPIDATAVDIARDWDTVESVVAFIARENQGS